VHGATVLELGPLEASHTYMLERAGARVVAVESNSRAYLKCLIVKELVPLTTARFLYGDFLPYLESLEQPFQLLVASGVLYHAPDPLRLLRAMARGANEIGLWTHYFDAAVMDANPGFGRLFDEQHTEQAGSRTVTLHRRNYLEALKFPGFCGGPEDTAVWMELPDLLAVLADLGFTDVVIDTDDHDHPHGPNVLLHARRVTSG
jgi:SAM-dependent methyltransferase